MVNTQCLALITAVSSRKSLHLAVRKGGKYVDVGEVTAGPLQLGYSTSLVRMRQLRSVIACNPSLGNRESIPLSHW